jgi:hypothetical protein
MAERLPSLASVVRVLRNPTLRIVGTCVAAAIFLFEKALLATLAVPTPSGPSMIFQSYDGSALPRNLEGNVFPYPYISDTEGGSFTQTLDSADSVSGNSIKLRLTSGAQLYAQFNPYDGTQRTFARDYSANPSQWRFNTYNRMSFWIKVPSEPNNLYDTQGRSAANVAAYAKCIALSGCPDYYSDETGGGHFYYNQNWPRTGTWVQVILNSYVDHWRGNDGGTEEPNALHPTDEPNYNIFDTLTRFYIQDETLQAPLPADYHLDEIKFYQETRLEAEEQVRDIAATYVPQSNRIIVTWYRNKNENSVNHEVRYAFSDIHVSGWGSATAAPNGIVVPPGWQGYNGMFYDTTALPLSGRSVVYVGIKPMSNNPQGLFTQVTIPLGATSSGSPTPSPPAAPTNVRIVP